MEDAGFTAEDPNAPVTAYFLLMEGSSYLWIFGLPPELRSTNLQKNI